MKLFKVYMLVEGRSTLTIEAEALNEAMEFAKDEANRMTEQSNGEVEYRVIFVEERGM